MANPSERKILILKGRLLKKAKRYTRPTVPNAGSELLSPVAALTRCNIAFIPYEVALRMIREHPEVGENYIRFLSEQVRLLQEETPGKFGTTTERLMTFLRERAVDGKFRLGFSMKTLASMLGMSRTGLYRAFADLESNGIIRRENKTIYFLQE